MSRWSELGIKRVSGLWKRGSGRRGSKEPWAFLKGALLDNNAFDSMFCYGEKTCFLVLKNHKKLKGKNDPDFFLCAVKSTSEGKAKEIFWEDIQNKSS